MSEHVVVIDQNNAQQVLIEESQQRPVLVDFWADWCEPCKTLMPLLEKLADEYQGQFLLAKINADEHQGIAQQLGVRSLPTVMLFKDGQPVDGFVGAQSEKEVRELLGKYLPKPWDALVDKANEALAAGETEQAQDLLKQAYADSGEQLDIALALVAVLIELNRLEQAEQILEGIRLADRDATWEQLHAQIELKRASARTPEIEALEAQLESDPDNLSLREQLAVQCNNAGMHREAMENLIDVLKVDREHGESRRILLDIIASLGKGDPVAVEFQRKLFGLMY